MSLDPKHETGHFDDMEKAPEHQHVEDAAAAGHKAGAATRYADMGAEWLETYTGPRHEITDADNTRVRWKIDMRLMPIICYIYWCQQLDKSTLSFAAVFNIQKDAGLVGTQYSWLSSIVYFAQLVCQPLSVYALVRFPVNIWISTCFFLWGTSLCIMTAMKSFAGLATMRFILGGFEASIAPSMLIVVAMWWTRREQPLRNNIWYSTNGLATILGSLLSYGLGHINSPHLRPYQIIFLACGLISVSLSIPTFFIFPRHPSRAKWLSDEDKFIALERIRLNQTGTQNTHFKWDQVRECIIDPKSWMWVLMVFCISLVSGGIGAFGPLILKGFGLTSFQTILYNMIPGAISIVSNIGTAFLIMKFKRKSPVLFVVSLFPLAAAVALYKLPRGNEHRHSLLAVFFILQVYQCITPIIFSWTFSNTAGHTKKTTTTGMLYLGLTVGNIVGPQLYKSAQAPYYHTGLEANMGCLVALSALILLQAFYLGILNKRNVARRRANGKTGELVDYSLESSSKWQSLRADQAAKDEAEGVKAQAAEHNAHGFDDLTDLQNEDFIYSQ